MQIELLLQRVSSISKKHELIQQKTGGYFNIFEITNIATAEVVICRVLHDLLNPKGSHYQGDKYLKLFVEHVLHINLTEAEYEQAKVHREYVIEGNRRIDLAIQTPSFFIPIEVKIYAGDQANQCFDYFQQAINSNVYYLTRFGDLPSEESAKECKGITAISFAHDILLWLSKCLEHKETLKIAPIREVLLQLMSAIRKFTNQLEDEQEMEIQDIISSTAENMKSAIAIEKSLKASRITMLSRLLKELETGIGKEKLHNSFDYEYDEGKKVRTYYDYKGSTYPGISYLYKEAVKPGVDIWFRIEIDYRLYAGFVVAVNGQATKQVLTEEEIQQHLPHLTPCVDNWWASWDFLPYDDADQSPDFKNPDEHDIYYRLFDKDYFANFVAESMRKIEELFV